MDHFSRKLVGQGFVSYVWRASSEFARDRTVPVGYKLSMVPFENGNPVASPENKSAAIDILANADNSACPKRCFRPVGIAFDRYGRLFFSSDATGEIYVVTKTQVLTQTDGNSTTNSPLDTDSSSPAVEKISHLFTGVVSFAFLIFITM